MDDMEVIKRRWCSYRKSLHETLHRYIAMEDDYIKLFLDQENSVYTYKYAENWEYPYNDDVRVFFSLEECMDDIKELWELYDEDELAHGIYYRPAGLKNHYIKLLF